MLKRKRRRSRSKKKKAKLILSYAPYVPYSKMDMRILREIYEKVRGIQYEVQDYAKAILIVEMQEEIDRYLAYPLLIDKARRLIIQYLRYIRY